MEKVIPWDIGGGNLHLVFSGNGNGNIVITSDTENLTGKTRAKIITISTNKGGSVSRQLLVSQLSKKAYVDNDTLIITSAVNSSVLSGTLKINDQDIDVTDETLIIQ